MKGRAVALGADTLVLETDTGRAALVADSVKRLEVRTGTHGNAGAGFLVGAVVGGAGLAGAAAATGSESDAYGALLMGGAFFGFVFGGALGAVLGAATRSDSWTEVPRGSLAHGWTYAVDSLPHGEQHARDSIAAVPVPDRATRVPLGHRARVVRSNGARIELLDAWVSADSVGGTALPDSAPVSLARGDLVRVLAPRGRHGHALLGTGLGLVAGVLGGVLVNLLGSGDSGSYDVAAFLGASIGAVTGLIAGGFVRSEDWVVVDLDAVGRGQQVR
jgi:hypothetical protein